MLHVLAEIPFDNIDGGAGHTSPSSIGMSRWPNTGSATSRTNAG
jgi:hypothetical protein